MGKNLIDSATMMNKIFEIMTKNLFKLSLKNLKL